jgi:hypothetical protein
VLTAVTSACGNGLSPKQPELLFEDDFEDGNANGWVPAAGAWKIVDNQYVCSTCTDARTIFMGEQWSDYTISASIRPLSGERGFSLLGRLQDANHYYAGGVYGGHAKIWRRDGGAPIVLGEAPYSTTNGTWYEVALELQGAYINLFINDVLIVSVEDTTYLEGRIGLGGTANSQVYFDNVKVKASLTE